MPLLRTYVALGVATNQKKGRPSRKEVALVPPPPAPAKPRVVYDEKAITVAWDAVVAPGGVARTSQATAER